MKQERTATVDDVPVPVVRRVRLNRFTSGNLKHFRERYPIMPLDHMMGVVNAPPGTPGVTDARRDEMAKAAAPIFIKNCHRSN